MSIGKENHSVASACFQCLRLRSAAIIPDVAKRSFGFSPPIYLSSDCLLNMVINGRNSSMGIGKIVVELLSVDISFMV